MVKLTFADAATEARALVFLHSRYPGQVTTADSVTVAPKDAVLDLADHRFGFNFIGLLNPPVATDSEVSPSAEPIP